MTKSELRSRCRARVRDEAPEKYLWTDDDFDEYLDEAQKEAARRAHLLVDSTSSIVCAVVTAGDLFVPVDSRILFIRRASLASSRGVLRQCTVREMDCMSPGWESDAPSTPLVFIPGWQSGGVALWPPSSRDDELRMTAVRLPKSGILEDDDSPEIPEHYHLALLDWVSYRAYTKQDSEGLDVKAAEKALLAFEKEFGASVGALNERFAYENYYDVGEFL